LVVPCGEHWPDQSLRPSLEEYVAAGGIIAAFDHTDLSAEARAAAIVYTGLGTQRSSALRSCGSARELLERGFADDVELCLAEDVSSGACSLQHGAFVGFESSHLRMACELPRPP
jgi:2-phosphosulfolactate phosphatase